MNLYLTAYNKAFDLLFTKKWMETDSLADITNYIKINHNVDCERHFPLINSTDLTNLKVYGKTVLLFTQDVYYFLHDIHNENNKGLLRDVIIDEILE